MSEVWIRIAQCFVAVKFQRIFCTHLRDRPYTFSQLLCYKLSTSEVIQSVRISVNSPMIYVGTKDLLSVFVHYFSLISSFSDINKDMTVNKRGLGECSQGKWGRLRFNVPQLLQIVWLSFTPTESNLGMLNRTDREKGRGQCVCACICDCSNADTPIQCM